MASDSTRISSPCFWRLSRGASSIHNGHSSRAIAATPRALGHRERSDRWDSTAVTHALPSRIGPQHTSHGVDPGLERPSLTTLDARSCPRRARRLAIFLLRPRRDRFDVSRVGFHGLARQREVRVLLAASEPLPAGHSSPHQGGHARRGGTDSPDAASVPGHGCRFHISLRRPRAHPSLSRRFVLASKNAGSVSTPSDRGRVAARAVRALCGVFQGGRAGAGHVLGGGTRKQHRSDLRDLRRRNPLTEEPIFLVGRSSLWWRCWRCMAICCWARAGDFVVGCGWSRSPPAFSSPPFEPYGQSRPRSSRRACSCI